MEADAGVVEDVLREEIELDVLREEIELDKLMQTGWDPEPSQRTNRDGGQHPDAMRKDTVSRCLFKQAKPRGAKVIFT